jgi:hypothetical protein
MQGIVISLGGCNGVQIYTRLPYGLVSQIKGNKDFD